MLIYRLQNSKNRGPYCVRHKYKKQLLRDHSDYKHPIPMNDGISFSLYLCPPDGAYWLCGFTHKKKLKAWFEGWLDRLAEVGFSIVKYKVKKKYVSIGRKQVIFSKKQAVRC